MKTTCLILIFFAAPLCAEDTLKTRAAVSSR